MNINKNTTSKPLLWISLAGITMFFAGITSAVIVSRPVDSWIHFPIPDWFLYSTYVIILSSILLIFANNQIKKDKSIFVLLFSVFILGLLFTYCQFMGWKELTNVHEVFFTGSKSSPSESFFYVITAAHLAHLFGGLVALLITSVNAKNKKYNSEDYLGLELASTYWHYLGILWIYLYLFLKYI